MSQKKKKGKTGGKICVNMTRSLKILSKGISKEKNKGGTRNKNRQNLGKLITNIEVGEILSDYHVDMSKGSDKDNDNEVQSGPMNNLISWDLKR